MPTANKIQLYSFREGKPLTNLKKFDGKVVPDSSAFFNRRDIEQTSMIMANHLDMCKFDNAQNPGYVSFRAALSDYLSCLQAQVTASQREERERFIAEVTQALDFGARIQRHQQLAKLLTSKATFEWVWSSEFAGWLVNKEPLFWISGRPASGKSTLMYHIAKSDRTQKLLQHSFGKQTTYIYHFFDFRAAGGLGNNFVGLVRSLLLQLISRLPHLSDRVLRLGALLREEYQWRSLGAGEFELAELSEVLLETLHAVPGHVFIALDGLDEYAGELMELISFIKSMAQLNTKVCLASRPDAPFTDAFAAMPSLKMHEVNAPGILTFARQVFDDAAIQRHWANQDQSHILAEEIVSQSQGVFLWARFATLEIVDGLSKGDLSPSDDLVAAVHQLPTDLEELYSRIICQASPEDRALARVILVYVAYALHTPKLIMLQSLLQLHNGDPSPWFREITYVNRWPEDIEPFKRKILASTGGLIEMYANSNARKAEGKLANMGLLHRTVKTYLENKGWTELSQSLSDPGCEQSLWLQSCAIVMHRHDDYLRRSMPIGRSSAKQFWYPFGPSRLSEEDTDSSESALNPRNRGRRAALSCPSVGVRLLMAYALTYMPAHARNFEERAKLSSYSILRNILSPSFCAAHPLLSDGMCVCLQARDYKTFDNIPKDLRLIVGHSLNGYIQECITTEGNQPMRAAQSLPSLPVNASVRSWLTASACAISRLGKQPVQKKEAIRLYAVQFAICDPNPLRVSTLRIALLHSPTVTDDELLAAIARANLGAIECMMSVRSPGKLLLRSEKSRRSEMPSYNMLIQHEDQFLGKLSGDIEMRPFWAVGRRDIAETEAVIDLLISRAENINEQCGPFGTVLHSYFDSIAGSMHYENHMFNLLVAKGADVNATGPYGTVLEFVWMLANTYKTSKLRYSFPFRSMIHELIEVGAVNNRKDPNGLVPSVERMKDFAITGDAYAEAKRFYKHGRRQPGVPAARWSYANLGDQFDDPGCWFRETVDENESPQGS